MDKRDKTHIAAGTAFAAASLLLQFCARRINGFATAYTHTIYKALVETFGRFFGIFPFSVVEAALYIMIILWLVYMAGNIKRPLKIIYRTVFYIGVILFTYTINCGVNYYSMPFSEYAGLEISSYTKDELTELCKYLIENVNKNVTAENYYDNKLVWKKEGAAAMEKAAEEFECLAGYYPKPKAVTCSYILSVQQLCGIYSPFTIEANFNKDMPDYNIPHTICHELSHLRGFMREDEANFIGYLACIMSDNQAYRYSGYLMGWVYAGNALAGIDMESYIELRNQLDSRAELDLQNNSIFWNRYEGKVAETSGRVNDTYLKINDQKDGVQSYGRMVDLMLSYMKTAKK